jgi:DNA-binding IclR family transcriptional regulator
MNLHSTGPCTVSIFRPFDELQLLHRVRGEFGEMPGMRLTTEQAMRLWSLDRSTCEGLLGELVAIHFLERDAFGRYKKAHAGY